MDSTEVSVPDWLGEAETGFRYNQVPATKIATAETQAKRDASLGTTVQAVAKRIDSVPRAAIADITLEANQGRGTSL